MNTASCHPLKTRPKSESAHPTVWPAVPARSTQYADGARRLFDLHLRADFFQLLLDRLDIGLGNAFLDYGRRAFDQILGLFQAQTRDLADDLDHGDFLVRRVLFQSHGELGLLLRGSCCCTTATG